MKVLSSLGNLQASSRGNCWDPAYSQAQPFDQPAERELCCAAFHCKQYAFYWLCLFLMNSKVITPHWKYIGAAIKISRCILIALSCLEMSRLSSRNLLELQVKQKRLDSLQSYLLQSESWTCKKLHEPQIIIGGKGKADLDFTWFHGFVNLQSHLMCENEAALASQVYLSIIAITTDVLWDGYKKADCIPTSKVDSSWWSWRT